MRVVVARASKSERWTIENVVSARPDECIRCKQPMIRGPGLHPMRVDGSLCDGCAADVDPLRFELLLALRS